MSQTTFRETDLDALFAREAWHLEPQMPGLLYGGRFSFEASLQFSSPGFDCYELLHVVKGGGTLSHKAGTLFLPEGSLLFLNLKQPLQFRISPAGMTASLFYLRSAEVTPYARLLCTDEPVLLRLPFKATREPHPGSSDFSEPPAEAQVPSPSVGRSASDAEFYCNRLLSLFPIRDSLAAVTASKWIISLLAELVALTLGSGEPATHIPDYLREMKETLDTNYPAPFRLENFEHRFSIHKDRLCREFSHYYGMPPLQYLNARRIEAARDLLLTTGMRVYEVGNAVGLENTNHFINLFKKSTGTTPMLFRRTAPSALCALHSPHTPDVRPQ